MASPAVLDDDTYTRALDAIIRRQFFPDLDRLRARVAMLEETSAGGIPGRAQERLEEVLRDAEPVTVNGEPLDPEQTPLNQFLQEYTSEDAASFQELFRKHQREHRQRYRWVFDREICFKAQLLKMGGEDAVAEYEREQERRRVEAAERQALMPPPPPRPPGSKVLSLVDHMKPLPEVNIGATRFATTQRGGAGKEATASAARSLEGAVWSGFVTDLDILAQRKLLNEQPKYTLDAFRKAPASPRVNGYGFVGTPQFSPGASDAGLSPLLTWGAVATPLTLAVDPNEYLQGPVFNIPRRSKRDVRAKQLADDAGRRMRQEKAAKQPRRMTTPGSAASRTPRSSPASAGMLSPAVRALAERCGKVRPASDLFGPVKRSRSLVSTPVTPTAWLDPTFHEPRPESERSVVPQQRPATPGGADGPSITDGLLKI